MTKNELVISYNTLESNKSDLIPPLNLVVPFPVGLCPPDDLEAAAHILTLCRDLSMN